MFSLETLIGLAAAFCTTVSYVPQLKKCWTTGSAGDLSLKMFGILATGVALWFVYGVMKKDVVIMLANGVSFLLLCAILFFKCRETFANRKTVPANYARRVPSPLWGGSANAARVSRGGVLKEKTPPGSLARSDLPTRGR
jgi:MtN3 and saliva related transmembrane protein